MQDEINHKVVALSVSTGKTGARMTANLLKAAMRKFLQDRQRKISRKAAQKPDHKVGKQTVKQLMKQNTGLSNIEITDKNIKSFERIANKYGIDFALKKDMNAEKPRYIVFFKARDVDVVTRAFEEYTAKTLVKAKKPSIIQKLHKFTEQSKEQATQQEHQKTRQKDRGMQL